MPLFCCCCCSVTKSCLTLQSHGLQHASLICPPWFPWVYSNSFPLTRWGCLTISSSVTPFSACPQSFPVSRSFPMSWLFASGGQSVRALASVLSVNIQGWFPLGLTGLISLLSKVLWRVFSSTTVRKHQFFFMVQLSYPYMTTGKTIALTIRTFVGKVMSLFFNTLYRFVIAFLPRSKCVLISCNSTLLSKC